MTQERDEERQWVCEDCGAEVIGDTAALDHCDEKGHSLAMGPGELERQLGPEALEAFPGLPDVVRMRRP